MSSGTNKERIDQNTESIKDSINNINNNIKVATAQSKIITPSISEQVINPDEGYDFLSDITVSAVDNTIDNNIVAENIKKDITILGITGTYEGDSITITDVSELPTEGTENEIVNVVSTENVFEGTYQYINGTWTRLDADITPTELEEATTVAEDILGTTT